MKFEYEIRENPRYIYSKLTGELSFISLIEVIKKINTVVKENEILEVLTDYREVSSSIHMVSIFEIPEQLELLGMPLNGRTAVLYNEKAETAGKFEMFISVAHEKGQVIELFSEEEKAIKWLIKKGTHGENNE